MTGYIPYTSCRCQKCELERLKHKAEEMNVWKFPPQVGPELPQNYFDEWFGAKVTKEDDWTEFSNYWGE